jgi:hypothetical protein
MSLNFRPQLPMNPGIPRISDFSLVVISLPEEVMVRNVNDFTWE